MERAGQIALGAALVVAVIGCKANKHVDAAAAVTFDGAEVTDPVALRAHGERLSYVLGCRGCHGKDLQGQKWDDDPKQWGVMWSSNLTRAIPAMSDAQLEALLRQGVHPVRGDLWMMPSELFQHLSAPDMAALIAHLRSIPASGVASPPPAQGPLALREVAAGHYKPAQQMVAQYRTVLPADAGPKFAQGRYITSVTCAECHGMLLEGGTTPEGTIPNLIVASGYSPAEFDLFITTGTVPGGRKINHLMVSVAQSRFSHLAPSERRELYGYLVARAALPQ